MKSFVRRRSPVPPPPVPLCIWPVTVWKTPLTSRRRTLARDVMAASRTTDHARDRRPRRSQHADHVAIEYSPPTCRFSFPSWLSQCRCVVRLRATNSPCVVAGHIPRRVVLPRRQMRTPRPPMRHLSVSPRRRPGGFRGQHRPLVFPVPVPSNTSHGVPVRLRHVGRNRDVVCSAAVRPARR